MAGGPFTQNDNWHHAGRVDRIECQKTVLCIKLNRELIAQIISEEGQIPALSGVRRYRLIVDDTDPNSPSLIPVEITT